jgi:N utilization substance protein B
MHRRSADWASIVNESALSSTMVLKVTPVFDCKLDFAKNLLETTIDKKEVSMELLKPKLKNWDAERIASLDLIIIQLGIIEFLFFDTIPTKVTINEYIDLAKDYSTPQSGQFINGILDNIHKDLSAEGRINKKSFKNSIL